MAITGKEVVQVARVFDKYWLDQLVIISSHDGKIAINAVLCPFLTDENGVDVFSDKRLSLSIKDLNKELSDAGIPNNGVNSIKDGILQLIEILGKRNGVL